LSDGESAKGKQYREENQGREETSVSGLSDDGAGEELRRKVWGREEYEVQRAENHELR